MREMNTPDELIEAFMKSELDENELKNIKKKKLIALLLKIKSLYNDQQSLNKVVEHQLHELLKTINELNKKEAQKKEKKETYINEKVLRKSLDILEKNKKIEKEILAVGEHYKVDIYKLIWKKPFIKFFYIHLSKKMKKSGFHDYKLNWERINKLIKHLGKPIEESKDKNIPPKKLQKIKDLVKITLE
jgi:hypothetical protein